MSYFITGTDTDVGKTIVSAWLMLHSPKALYWKPIQAGQCDRDINRVQNLTKLPQARFVPSLYDLVEPLSPHESARRENIEIEWDKLQIPTSHSPLIVEGAGGLLVPLNRHYFLVDLIKKLQIPVILVARSGLGTINHTLMSLEIIRNRNIPIAGVILNGSLSPHNKQAIEEYGQVKILAEIPKLTRLDKDALMAIRPQQKILVNERDI